MTTIALALALALAITLKFLFRGKTPKRILETRSVEISRSEFRSNARKFL